MGCFAGPGVLPGRGRLLHITDRSRAIADPAGAALPRESIGRPPAVALAAPPAPDDALPAMTLRAGAIAMLIVAAGAALTIAMARVRWPSSHEPSGWMAHASFSLGRSISTNAIRSAVVTGAADSFTSLQGRILDDNDPPDR